VGPVGANRKAMFTTLVLAWRLESIRAFPYTFIVVDTWACRISFCCTPTGAPATSNHDR